MGKGCWGDVGIGGTSELREKNGQGQHEVLKQKAQMVVGCLGHIRPIYCTSACKSGGTMKPNNKSSDPQY